MKKRTTRLQIHRETLVQLEKQPTAAALLQFAEIGRDSGKLCTSPFCGPSTCVPCEGVG
jgi:hypothetical protein